MVAPVVQDFTVDGVTLVDADSLAREGRVLVLKMCADSLDLIPEKMRCTDEECIGGVASVVMGAYGPDSELVGCVSIAGISVVGQVGNLLKVRAIVLPYFPGVPDELSTVTALYVHLFQEPVPLRNGTQIAILDLMRLKRLKVLDEAVPSEARIKAIIQKIEDSGFSSILPDPEDPDREIVTVNREAP